MFIDAILIQVGPVVKLLLCLGFRKIDSKKQEE